MIYRATDGHCFLKLNGPFFVIVTNFSIANNVTNKLVRNTSEMEN